MIDPIRDIAYAIAPTELPLINEFDYEVDGDEIKLSLLIGENWTDETITRKVFESWLNENDYLKGSDDIPSGYGQGQMETVYWNFTYEEFIENHLTQFVIGQYLIDTHQYRLS